MMATMATPARKLVHWNSDSYENSDPGSPSSQFSEDSFVSTSSLQYVNSQLIAHGFTSTPGVSLDGLSKRDTDKAVKCFLDLLAQRVKDMSRTEHLTTELRTLRYDHERMVSMYRTASESAANFEREVNLQKSRLAATTKTLQATEAAHKHTNAEMQRTRSALQAIRVTHQAELKKKEKEVERNMERWNKIADAQAKLGATASGLRFGGSANAAVEPATQIFGKGKSYLEVALEEAEKAREQLGRDNLGLRKMVLKAVNEVQKVAFELKQTLQRPANDMEAPTPMTLPELFPISPPDFTITTLSTSLARLRDILRVLSSPTPSTANSPSTSLVPHSAPSQSELEQLNLVIEELKNKLHSSNQVAYRSAQTQTVLNRFETEELSFNYPLPTASDNNSTDVSVDLILDQKRERLAVLKKGEERQRHIGATVQLRKYRIGTEAEKTRLKEGNLSWPVSTTIAELASVPDCSESQSAQAAKQTSKPKSSPRKPQSPSKRFQINVGKATRRATRVGTVRRRSTSSSQSIIEDAEPAFETEVMPRLSHSNLTGTPVPPLMPTSSSTESLLPTAFVLPPPSPCASLPPPKPALLLSAASTLPVPIPSLHVSHESNEIDQSHLQPSLLSHVPPSTALPDPIDPFPHTPLAVARRAFPYPVAKPLATHMIHAYSPVRPSPLSRILMLGNSPESPSSIGIKEEHDIRGLEALVEADELNERFRDDSLELELFPPIPQSRASSDDEGGLTLAQQLGVSDSPPESPVYIRPESPLREKQIQNNIIRRSQPSKFMTNKARVPPKPTFGASKPRASSTVEKGTGMKSKARSMGPSSVTKGMVRRGERQSSVSTGGNEKENSSHPARSHPEMADREMSERTQVKSAVLNANARQQGSGRGVSGPRRVPIDSAEAPPIGRKRKL